MKHFLFSLLLISAFVINGCQQEVPVQSEDLSGTAINKWGLPKDVTQQLQAAKIATARYHNIEHALADGYEDIHVVVPHMGHHYANMDLLLDGTFEVTKPEILVYTQMPNGHMKLVAVEYGVPLSITPVAPEGFIGDYDEWTENTDAGIWALHAWIWKDNPDGVFASFNPLVP